MQKLARPRRWLLILALAGATPFPAPVAFAQLASSRVQQAHIDNWVLSQVGVK